MKKTILFFSFFLTFSTCFAQSFFFGKYEIKKRSEELFKKYSNVKDSVSLRKSQTLELSESGGRLEKKTVQVVFNILKAENQTFYTDNLNKKSEEFYKKAIVEAENSGIMALQIWANTRYAYYLYNYRRMQLSLPVFLESINLIDANSEDVYIEGYDTYKKIGYYLLTLGQPKEALRFLKDAEKTCPKDSPELAALWDNIANNYIKTGNYAAAKTYLKKALIFSRKINDEVRYAKVIGNMALINSKEGKSQLAIEQLLEDIQISEKNKSDQNTMYALTLLSKVYLEINDVENAEKSALKALEYAKSKPYFKTNEYDITEILVKTAQIKNHEHDELLLRRKADELKEITDKEDSHYAVSEVNWIAQKELVENRLNMVKAQSDRENLLKNISYILLALLLVIFFLIHFLSKRRKKMNDQEYQNMLLKLKLDNLNAERKLDENQKTILSFNMSISQKNSQIEFLEKELIKVENSTTSDVSEQKSEINELLKTHLMTKENWDNFKQAFIVDEPEYYSYIQENFDDLTDSNLRLVILMKLKLDNKQIAQVLGITQDAVKKAKQRLRKKLSDKYDALLDSHYNQN